MSLRRKTTAGLIWTFSQQFGSQTISFFITIILARILAPSEFGLIAMLSVFISIGSSLMESGLTSSLIRARDADQKDYSTVFFFNLIGSVVIYIIVYFLAPFISLFYHQEILTNILRVYALSFILNAFFEVQNARLTKDMNFRLQMLIQIPSVLFSGVLGVTLAYLGFGVWSLVWMNLFQSFLITIQHWIFTDWRPDFLFDKASFKKHFHFGYKMTLSGVLETIYKNIYVLIIGKSYSAAQLGFYSRADSISQLPIGNISAALSKVTFPMFSSISDEDTKLKNVYKKLMQQVIFWNAPVLIFLCVIAEPLFRFLITEKWLPSVPYFQILCISGIMYPLHSYNLNILKVKGRSDLILKLELIKKAICIIGILCVIPFGIYGLLYFQLLFNFIGYFINSIYSGKLINYPIKEQIKDIYPTIGLSACIGLICYFFDAFLIYSFKMPDLGRIMIGGIVYLSMYLGCSNLIQLSAINDFKQLILRRL